MNRGTTQDLKLARHLGKTPDQRLGEARVRGGRCTNQGSDKDQIIERQLRGKDPYLVGQKGRHARQTKAGESFLEEQAFSTRHKRW